MKLSKDRQPRFIGTLTLIGLQYVPYDREPVSNITIFASVDHLSDWLSELDCITEPNGLAVSLYVFGATLRVFLELRTDG